MTQRYSIELIEEHEAVNIYSLHLEEEELSELERFLRNFLKDVRSTKISTPLFPGLIKSEKEARWNDTLDPKANLETECLRFQ